MLHRRSALQNSADALTLGSMAFTGFFGWVAGGDYLFFCIVGAAVGAVISFASPLLWCEVGRRQADGQARTAIVLGVFAALFLLVDALTNIGSVFAMRQTEIVGAHHQTELAGDARNEVKRLEARISEVRAQTAWKTTYLSPEAYDAKILALKNETENGRNIFKRSKECTDTTVESSQRVCQAIATAIANKSNALNRLALKEEVKQLESELVDAKAQAHDTPPKVSAAWTQVEKLAALATLNIDPSQSTKEVAYLLITGIFGLVTSIGAAVLSWAIGTGAQIQSGKPSSAAVSQSPYLPNYSPHPPRDLTPASRTVSQTFVVPGGTVTGNNSDLLIELRRKVAQSKRELEAA